RKRPGSTIGWSDPRGQRGAAVRYRAASALGAITALAATGGGDDDGTFDTAEPAQLVATAPRVEIDPILTAGDVVDDYQMSGIPDGLGAFEQDGRIQLYRN